MKKPVIIEIIIWFVILTIVFTLGFFAYSKIFIEPNLYNIEFQDINGITVGSPVRFMGINIGYVKKLQPKEKHVNVTIVVTAKNMMIPNGTLARIEFYGLGGSKSVELMPADSPNAQGIVSTNTLRLHDMAMKTESLVDILEIIEKIVKGVNKPSAQKMLEGISEIKSSKIDTVNSNLQNFQDNISQKFDSIRIKQADMNKKINSMTETTQKLNKFIKK